MKKSKIKHSLSDRILQIFAYCFIGLIAIVCIYPLLLVLGVSFSREADIASVGYSVWPKHFSLDTYIYIFANSGKDILRSYGVTILITVVGTIGSLLITSMMSFALSVRTLKYRNIIAFICDFTIIFSAGLIPWYVVCVNVYQLKNTLFALILPSMFSVWNMFLLRTYFSAI